jgi:pimeloyl-ACP methyl ester carboxylesterase
VVGISGGGPHAAACARFLPDRVTAAAIVSGVAPLAEPGSEAGMLSSDMRFTRLARRSPALTRPLFAAMATANRRWPERTLDMVARELGPVDAAVLQRPEVHAHFLADLRASARTTGAALTDEFALFTRDWGFRLEDITVPVHLWHGDADRDVPFEHALRQAGAIPGAVLHECPGEGHLLAVDHMEEILRLVATTS